MSKMRIRAYPDCNSRLNEFSCNSTIPPPPSPHNPLNPLPSPSPYHFTPPVICEPSRAESTTSAAPPLESGSWKMGGGGEGGCGATGLPGVVPSSFFGINKGEQGASMLVKMALLIRIRYPPLPPTTFLHHSLPPSHTPLISSTRPIPFHPHKIRLSHLRSTRFSPLLDFLQ